MKILLLLGITFYCCLLATAQPMTVITADNTRINLSIVPDSLSHHGKQDNTLRHPFTARTYRLDDGRILLEFYDKQAALIKNTADFQKLKTVRFVKNYIDFLKKNISYKIELPLEKGLALAGTAKHLSNFKSDMPEYFDFEVYELTTGQMLFINKSKSATIYENMKPLCSDNSDIANKYYGDTEAWAKKLVGGDPLFDYETDGFLVWPQDISQLIKNHQLTLKETKVYVGQFYSNLYQSARGYYVLIDEINQKNGGGRKMGILTVRMYKQLQDLRNAQARYQKEKNRPILSEHFYQNISDSYGRDFPRHTQKLIDSLPLLLNFDKDQLSFDSAGMAIVDEAIRWNHNNYPLFNRWFPCVLAYYGQCYMTHFKDGQWQMKRDTEYNVWIPHLILSNGEEAFDVRDFYKDLFEWPTPLQWVGDWDGTRKANRNKLRVDDIP